MLNKYNTDVMIFNKRIVFIFLFCVALFGNFACTKDHDDALEEKIVEQSQSVRRSFSNGHYLINDYYASDEVRQSINHAPYS